MWTEANNDTLLAEFATRNAVELAREMGFCVWTLYKKAKALGFRKRTRGSWHFCPDGEQPAQEISLWPYKEGEFAWLNDRKYDRTRWERL
ncbi:MAG: hypothetical protein WC340_16850 [Kiritimatiellia bacterium]